MAGVAFTRFDGVPNSPPKYDPRDGFGITFHADTSANNIWLGLSRSGDVKWGRFENYTRSSGSGSVGNFNRNFPVVTTSGSPPDFAPQFVPSDGRIHLHISYVSESEFHMYLGTGKTTLTGIAWNRYDIVETIS